MNADDPRSIWDMPPEDEHKSRRDDIAAATIPLGAAALVLVLLLLNARP